MGFALLGIGIVFGVGIAVAIWYCFHCCYCCYRCYYGIIPLSSYLYGAVQYTIRMSCYTLKMRLPPSYVGNSEERYQIVVESHDSGSL